MVSELDTRRCASKEAEPRRRVDTRRCASKDAGSQKEVNLGGPASVEEGSEYQRGRSQRGVNCEILYRQGMRTKNSL